MLSSPCPVHFSPSPVHFRKGAGRQNLKENTKKQPMEAGCKKAEKEWGVADRPTLVIHLELSSEKSQKL